MKDSNWTLKDSRPLGEMVAPLLSWYRQNQRILPWRENTDPYRVWISEIMLQQTRVDTVIPYYLRFLAALPDIRSLAEAPEEQLLKLWEGLGYYSRVRNLQRAAKQIVERHGGVFPSGFDEVRRLTGIGDYTAGAICSIAFSQPTPAVDGNVLRVISRLCKNPYDIKEATTKKQVTEQLAKIYPDEGRGDFTQSLMELGAIVCLPNGAPLCDRCPLKALCAAADDDPTQYPIVPPKPVKKIVPMTVFCLRHGDRFAVRKRPQNGLLAGLWELPNLDGTLSEKAVSDYLQAHSIHGTVEAKPRKKKHIFTHIEWQMLCYDIVCAEESPEFCWVTADEIALPTAFKKLIK
ncbi:MAG: A/G-specific adenine glycosylase [Clostridia bacterium]|nr:A/G-specific adenine glycosylase [Clostridia bacterium]